MKNIVKKSNKNPTNTLLTPPLIILGMHRSGTSLLARILNELGVYLGKDLHGHFESRCFRNINNELLATAGSHWAKPDAFLAAIETEKFITQCHALVKASLEEEIGNYGNPSEFDFWGWKDPRNTLTLPIWLQCFPNSKRIYIFRNGIDVALSIYRREIRYLLKNSAENRLFPPTIGASFRLWETYMKVGKQLCFRSQNCFSLRYEDLLFDSKNQIREIIKFIGIEFDERRIELIVKKFIRKPTERSKSENIRLRLLSRTGFLNLDSLKEYGY
jgi:hypothetical protein